MTATILGPVELPQPKSLVLGLFAAQLAAPIALAFTLGFDSGAKGLLLFLPGVLSLAVVTCLVTVPATILLGLPAIGIYRQCGWVDWPRHLLGGSLIGTGVAMIPFLTELERAWPFVLAAGLFGALAASAFWLVVYGKRRAWRVFLGLCLLAVLVRVGYLAFSGLA